jgi:hypothetical protein
MILAVTFISAGLVADLSGTTTYYTFLSLTFLFNLSVVPQPPDQRMIKHRRLPKLPGCGLVQPRH